jgi:maltose O-acetyltransferase
MLAGEIYLADDPDLVAGRNRARETCRRFNATGDMQILYDLVGRIGDGVKIEAPFYCDYGTNIEIGDRTFVNFNCTILDCNTVRIGSHCQLATSVQILTATHVVEPEPRRAGDEYALPIVIEDNVWLGGGAIVLPGVTVGENSIVGAGAVVTKDVPPNVVAAGNPARVLRVL